MKRIKYNNIYIIFNMQIQINDKKKRDIFVSIFHILKSCSSTTNLILNSDTFHIQGMDKSHICLFDLKLDSKWFDNYNVTNKSQIAFNTGTFHSIIGLKADNQNLIITMTADEPDSLHIRFENDGEKPKKSASELKKAFKLPLIEYEYEEMNIPSPDYDAEFSYTSKQISDVFSQLGGFGDDIIVKCSENEINLTSKGVDGEMMVNIPIDDLSSFSIVEGEEITLTYSLVYINKMCITNKLSADIDFSLSNECPLKINYSLGEDSALVFFIAPKINE